MDLEDIKLCLRGLLSSTALSCNLNQLLNDFRKMMGYDLPLFGYLHPVEFLRTLDDTVKLFGNPYNPEVALVQSKKSAHITSLVDRQNKSAVSNKYPQFMSKPKRLIIPDRKLMEMNCLVSKPSQCNKSEETKTSQNHSRPKEQVPKTDLPQNQFDCDIPDKAGKAPDADKNKQLSPVKSNSCKGKSIESNKGKSSYFEDSESGLCIEDFLSSSSCFVNDGMKNKLKKLIRCHPKGVWCCELPELFLKEYNYALDYREFGYTSLIQMLSELPDVFRCVRPGNEDWLLFDASIAPSPEEKKMSDLQATADINPEITSSLKKFFFTSFGNVANPRIDLDKILELYKKMFGCCLDFQSFGFKDLKSFLKTWEGDLFSFLEFDGKTVLVPALKITVQSTLPWAEALPPITAENDIFFEIFPKEVVGPEESLLELDLARHVAVGNVIKVSIAEVWSPSQFYLQLNKFKNRLNIFMENLQQFYNVHLNKYKMPESTIRPKQVCVGLYTTDPELPDEWHRAQIIKVINEKIVLVNFIDFGTETRIKKTHLRFLHRSFQSFPVQGFLSQLSGVVPVNGETKWPISTSKRFLELVRVAYLDAEIVDIDFKKPRMSVILLDPLVKSGLSINKKLVQENLACWREPELCRLVHNLGNVSAETGNGTESKKQQEEKGRTDTVPSEGRKEMFNLPELTDEFSDIVDLVQATSSRFRMKSVNHQSVPQMTVNSKEKNSIENLKYEFEDVPDLDTTVKINKVDQTKGRKRIEDALNKKNSSFPSPSREIRKPGSLPSTDPENIPYLRPISVDSSLQNLPLPSSPLPEFFPPPQAPDLTPAIHSASEKSQSSQPPPLKSPTPERELSFSQSNIVPKTNFIPFRLKPKRLPLDLKHPNPLLRLQQIESLPPSDDLKKKINILTMEFLTTNTSIKQVGVNDPVLAVKLATEMAEACITSKYTKKLNLSSSKRDSNATNMSSEKVQEMKKVTKAETPPQNVPDSISPGEDQSETSPGKRQNENEYVKEIQIGGKTVHLVTIEEELYFCAEEIIRTFTVITNREVAERILQLKKIQIQYRIISKASDEEVVKGIKSSQLQVVKRKTKKLKIYLIPLKSIVKFLQGVGCNTTSFEKDFQISVEGGFL